MTARNRTQDAVLAALQRANPVLDAAALGGPASSRAQALLSAITGEREEATAAGSHTWLLHDHVRVEIRGRVAVAWIDDGKVNVLTPEILAALDRAVDLCEADGEIGALLIVGRPQHFSAGVDRAVFLTSPDAVRGVLGSVARLVVRIYASKLPVVAACTGNAIAAGALLLLGAGVRVAARGQYRIGLNETAIGLPFPPWAATLARERLARQHYQRATLMAHLYAPDGALAAGFVDRVVGPEEVFETALREAEELAALDPEAYAATVLTTRGDALARIEALIEQDYGDGMRLR